MLLCSSKLEQSAASAEMLIIVFVNLGVHVLLLAQTCHAGDALADSATVEGGFAGLVVDLFGEGKVIAELQQVSLPYIGIDTLALHGSSCLGLDFL